MKKSRLEAIELNKDELDLVILGKLAALTKSHETATSGHPSRQTLHTTFLHSGHKVCKNTFLFLHNIVGLRDSKTLVNTSNEMVLWEECMATYDRGHTMLSVYLPSSQ